LAGHEAEMIASASERSNEGLTSTGKGSRRGSLKRAAHPLRAMAGRGVQLRAKFALSSSPFGSRSLHVTNPEALPPPAPAAHALLRIADHGGRWSRHSRGTPGQKPYCNPDSDSFSHHGHPPLRLKPTVLHLRAHPRVAQSVRRGAAPATTAQKIRGRVTTGVRPRVRGSHGNPGVQASGGPAG